MIFPPQFHMKFRNHGPPPPPYLGKIPQKNHFFGVFPNQFSYIDHGFRLNCHSEAATKQVSSGVELGGVGWSNLPSFLGPQLGLVSAHLLTFFSRSDGIQNHCTGLVLMLIRSYYQIPIPSCPPCHVFAYNRANTGTSVLKLFPIMCWKSSKLFTP